MRFIYTNRIDFWLIKFPIVFPVIYLFIYLSFPKYEYILIIGTILLLAEPRFAATYPFLFNKSNKDLIKNNKFVYCFQILIILFLITAISITAFLLIFYFASFS